MELLEEILIEVAMIVAVVVAVACLAHLLQLTIREQLYLWRTRREGTDDSNGYVHSPASQTQSIGPKKPLAQRDTAVTLREKRA